MKSLPNEVETNRINAVQDDFDRNEERFDYMEAEREKEAAEKANDLRADLEYLVQKHGIAAVNKALYQIAKPDEDFIMIAESANVGSTSVVIVSGETANEGIPALCRTEREALNEAVKEVCNKLGISRAAAKLNGIVAYSNIDLGTCNVPAIFFRSENKKTGQKASAKVGWYK